LVTFHLFTLAAVFFRSPNLQAALDYFGKMLSLRGGPELLTPFLLVLTAGAVGVQFLPGNGIERLAERLRTWPVVALGFAFGVGLLLIEAIAPDGVPPFIYFQF
jgi:hypothetical protein